jgi:hypothetical protein
MVAVLYKIGKEELAPYKPLLKFLVIKLIIFFAYWQGIAVIAATSLNLIPSTDSLSAAEMGLAIQVHKYFFSLSLSGGQF